MIITVTLNPAVDKTLVVPNFTVDSVNRVEKMQLDPGGKGINVSKSVQALGADTMCLGILGGSTGTYIKSALDAMGLKHDMVMTAAPTRTNTKIVDLQRGTNTDINEPGAAVSEETMQKVWEKLIHTAKPGDTVVFAGKNPPGTPEDLLANWTAKLRSVGVRVCVDTVGEPMQLALRQEPSVIKPNKEELNDLIGRELKTEKEILEAARDLICLGVELVVVSMGAEGALFVSREESVRAYSPKVHVVSTVGAGDSMMAAVAWCLENGDNLEQMARKATAVASATVQVSGSRPADYGQILPLIKEVKTEKM